MGFYKGCTNFPQNALSQTSRQGSHLKEFGVHMKRDMFFHVKSHLLVRQSKSTQLGKIIESSSEQAGEREKAELIYAPKCL